MNQLDSQVQVQGQMQLPQVVVVVGSGSVMGSLMVVVQSMQSVKLALRSVRVQPEQCVQLVLPSVWTVQPVQLLPIPPPPV